VIVHNVTFHGVGPPPDDVSEEEAGWWVTERQFLDVLDATEGRPDVRLFFDDGHRSDIGIVLPALLQRGRLATFFVVAGLVGKPGRLSGEDVRTLALASMTIGSHGMTHRSWRGLSIPDLTREVTRSRDLLSELSGFRTASAAMPFGAYDARVLRVLRDAGYSAVFTCDGGHARLGQWLQTRRVVTMRDDAMSVPSNRVGRRVRTLLKRYRRGR
jgi:peptidoglycan/xylan/chitin deacetylase (PgdA/CDA1 family)